MSDSGYITPTEEVKLRIERETDDLKPIPLKWKRLSDATGFLEPGTLAVIGGAPGSGKSFMSLMIGLTCQMCNEKWAYLPLESDRILYFRRMAAIINENWDSLLKTNKDKNATVKAKAAMDSAKIYIDAMDSSIYDNPNKPCEDGTIVPATPIFVSCWVKDNFKRGKRVVIVDPLAGMKFGTGNRGLEQQEDFIQELIRLAYVYDGTVVLVAHTTKKVEGKVYEVGDLQGGAIIGRLAASVVIVQAHDDKDSHVYCDPTHTEEVAHNRTITIAKARNAEGGRPLAFSFGKNGAVYEEHGFIAPKGKENPKPPEPSNDWYADD